MARKKTAESTEALLNLRPNMATKITPHKVYKKKLCAILH
jgi:hypothetical protein